MAESEVKDATIKSAQGNGETKRGRGLPPPGKKVINKISGQTPAIPPGMKKMFCRDHNNYLSVGSTSPRR